ncbi:hypothetical protein GCM10007870_07580 [Gluconobacter kondonii]|uniref:Uncharacterized protein n=1 Tax=Gluconobacter kondonii TaxID=941463 RepID=A0ABQ5WR66_9PROT|nr:hypothetical protein GCM10007870_07580 [Gluconobacter kondonii]
MRAAGDHGFPPRNPAYEHAQKTPRNRGQKEDGNKQGNGHGGGTLADLQSHDKLMRSVRLSRKTAGVLHGFG